MSAIEVEYADDAQSSSKQGDSCEIGSLDMPRSEWLFSASASFQQNYGQVHPFLAAVLCVVGTLMNAITVLVLTRPSMRSPVNVLLSAVAVCDIIVMSSYLVFVVHFLFTAASRCEPSDFSFGWALFMIFHAHSSVIFHAASIWMTVSLAQIRVLTIRRATAGPSTPLITERCTVLLAVLMLCAMTLVNLPNFLTFEITEVSSSSMLPCLHSTDANESAEFDDSLKAAKVIVTAFSKNHSIGTHPKNGISSNEQMLINIPQLNISNNFDHHFTFTTTAPKRIRRHRMIRHIRRSFPGKASDAKGDFAYTVRAHDSDCMKLKLAFWSNGMIFKVIPCLLLTLSIWALLRIIADVAHKRRNLAQVMRKKVPKDHTTPMLAAVLLIFLLAELPQGVFLVLNGIFSSESFHKRVYLPLGDLMDLLSLINSAVGFFIYVGMSRKFRTVFLQLLFTLLGCLTRAELFLASVLRPMLELVWPCRLCKSGKRTGIVGEGGGRDEDGGGGGGGVKGIHQSLRRLRERLEIGEEFSQTLQLLEDTAQRRFSSAAAAAAIGENVPQRRDRKGSMIKLLERGEHTHSAKGHSRNTKRDTLAKTRAHSTEQYNPKSVVDGDKRDPTAESERHWRRRTSGTSGASCLLSGVDQYPQQQRHNQTSLGQNAGGGASADRERNRKQQNGIRGRRRWNSWRRRRMSAWTSTEVTNTEQLSMCPSSLVGLPPLTLAFSCSAGITAAAASVGVHLLHLENAPPPATAATRAPSPFGGPSGSGRRRSSHLSSVFLTLPMPTSAHAIRRRLSDSAEDKNFLRVPKRPSLLLPSDGERTEPKKGASLLSLKGDEAVTEHQQQPQAQKGGQFEHPPKRISFNLPNWEEGQLQTEERRALEEGRRMRRRSVNTLGIVQQLRRWSMMRDNDDEEHRASKETDGVKKNDAVLENGHEGRTNSNASLLAAQKGRFKGNQRHGTFALILDRWNGAQRQQRQQLETETAIDC